MSDKVKANTRIVRKARTVSFNILDIADSYLESWAIEAHSVNNLRKRRAIKAWHEENDKFLKELKSFQRDGEAPSDCEARLEDEFYKQVLGEE